MATSASRLFGVDIERGALLLLLSLDLNGWTLSVASDVAAYLTHVDSRTNIAQNKARKARPPETRETARQRSNEHLCSISLIISSQNAQHTRPNGFSPSLRDSICGSVCVRLFTPRSTASQPSPSISTNSIKLHSNASASKPYATRKLLFFSCCRCCFVPSLVSLFAFEFITVVVIIIMWLAGAGSSWRRQFSIFMHMQYFFFFFCRKIETHRQFRCTRAVHAVGTRRAHVPHYIMPNIHSLALAGIPIRPVSIK